MIKHDGSARGFTQIVLTYSLGSVSMLLGLATLWLACGTLARDVEECQMQMVAVKPIARWQIWLGKWLGLVALNGVLLVVSGLAIYGVLTWRARLLAQLPSIRLTLVIGAYAQAWHLKPGTGVTLTAAVRSWRGQGAQVLPLPHPSPRNNGWLQRNPWFEAEVLPELKARVSALRGE